MYTKRRFSFTSVLIWTKKELIFFTIFSTIITIAFELLEIRWFQIPFAPVGLVGTAVAFLVGFQNNAAYDRIWEARKIWGGIVNTSRSMIITLKDSFYVHNPSEAKVETEELRIITNRHIAWLTALRYAMRARKPWEASYDDIHAKVSFKYLVPEYASSLEDELSPYLSKEEYELVMSKENKPNAIMSLQSKHLRQLTDQKKIWDLVSCNFRQCCKNSHPFKDRPKESKTSHIQNSMEVLDIISFTYLCGYFPWPLFLLLQLWEQILQPRIPLSAITSYG